MHRYKLSNLFLDTPYNAHSTAVDCLSQGTPLLTIKGQGFGWRVGASLLHSLKVDELITHSKKEYKNLAIYFGRNQNKLDEIKLKINNSLKGSFLDVSNTVINLEKAYLRIFERLNQNLPPDHIDL